MTYRPQRRPLLLKGTLRRPDQLYEVSNIRLQLIVTLLGKSQLSKYMRRHLHCVVFVFPQSDLHLYLLEFEPTIVLFEDKNHAILINQ